MARREVSLFLKYPGPSHVLRRLQHSFLECVVEYKFGTEEELQRLSPAQLRSAYQLKGTATLADDEIVVQFAPKHSGVHTVHIFADTRALCRPVAFIVTRGCDAQTIPFDRPLQSTTLAPTPLPVLVGQRHAPANPLSAGPSQPSHPPPSQQRQQPQQIYQPTMQTTQAQQQSEPPLMRSFNADSSIAVGQQDPFQRTSYVSTGSNRPPSMIQDEAAFAGDLFTTKPDQNSFNDLYASKRAGYSMYGTNGRGMFTANPGALVTPATFRMIRKDIDLRLAHIKGKKFKKRCCICSKKAKHSKSVSLGEEDYCEPCFRRQYLLRSAIEHFMVPSIQECTIEVPVNKKGTKFISTRKTIPNVNLRGLEPSDVRNAQVEFRKFDMENDGWVSKAVLFPLMKACFANSLTETETKTLLTSTALRSLIQNFGIEQRDEVHEIEFLSLLAFIARERERLRGSTNPNAKFTRSDLEMAYAFQRQFGAKQRTGNPLQRRPTMDTGYQAVQNPLQNEGDFRRASQRESLLIPKSPTESEIGSMNNPRLSFHTTTGISPSAMSPLHQNPSPAHSSMTPVPWLSRSRQPSIGDVQSPQRRLSSFGSPLSSSMNTSGFHEMEGNLRPAEIEEERPEEDQDDGELPTIPPGKDPSSPRLTSPPLIKGHPNDKQMMEELKLTGGSADSWMLY